MLLTHKLGRIKLQKKASHDGHQGKEEEVTEKKRKKTKWAHNRTIKYVTNYGSLSDHMHGNSILLFRHALLPAEIYWI